MALFEGPGGVSAGGFVILSQSRCCHMAHAGPSI